MLSPIKSFHGLSLSLLEEAPLNKWSLLWLQIIVHCSFWQLPESAFPPDSLLSVISSPLPSWSWVYTRHRLFSYPCFWEAPCLDPGLPSPHTSLHWLGTPHADSWLVLSIIHRIPLEPKDHQKLQGDCVCVYVEGRFPLSLISLCFPSTKLPPQECFPTQGGRKKPEVPGGGVATSAGGTLSSLVFQDYFTITETTSHMQSLAGKQKVQVWIGGACVWG